MRAISYTYARKNLAGTMKEVCENRDPVIVTRRNHESVVIMSLEDYESLNETSYLVQSPRNAERLLESIKELDEGKGKQKELKE